LKHSKIFIAGHTGLVGQAFVRKFQSDGNSTLLLRTHGGLDLANQAAVSDFFSKERPGLVILAAAKVGGILANSTYPAEFIYENLMIQSNDIHQSYLHGVKELVYLGSTCAYLKNTLQPMKEDSTIMPTNLYGIHDNYHPENSHVIPGMMRRIHEAKMADLPEVEIWGSGLPKREFLFVDDLVEACLFLLDYDKYYSAVNIGSQEEVSIRELAIMINEVVGYKGRLAFDTSKPDGMPLKKVDTSKMDALGWKARTPLREGLQEVYCWFLTNNISKNNNS